MNQSSFIAAMLLTLFVLFLAANNRLGVYAALLWGGSTSTAPSPVAGNVGLSSNPVAGVPTDASSAIGGPAWFQNGIKSILGM